MLQKQKQSTNLTPKSKQTPQNKKKTHQKTPFSPCLNLTPKNKNIKPPKYFH